jgi:hypothetical protein
MRKRIKKIAMLAIATVAIGVASLTSCTKEEESLTNNVPAMELKNGEPEILYTPCIISHEYLFWRVQIIPNNMGGNDTIKDCVNWYNPYTELPCICAVSIKSPVQDMELSRLETLDGKIKRIVLYTSGMDGKLKEKFLDLVNKATITFAIDSPITDEDLLAQLDDNYIPAGTYPVRMEDENFIITISE